MRVGLGFDTHPLVSGKALYLGGVEIPHSKGLEGVSDADVLLHAICDALLGAAGEGDMGQHFPESDPRFKNMPSDYFITQVEKMVSQKKLKISNLDCVVVCEKPRLAPYFDIMRQKISSLIGIPEERVSVKAKTTEGLGFTGRQEGITAYAIVCLEENR